ncbi:helix-turn-helix domain-containing protein [Nitrospinae bacterium AH_259_B05_G02_I21]|nr:helix-turn-helix domain-containing protein [Nitrospinae bacterium AH_259_B05_G02_I21]MDA2932223.1 helix-turn-helix domain-containing protein [Nitrospinae bacterium AH-259-F20]
MGRTAKARVDTPRPPRKIPEPSGQIEIDGRSMVVISIDDWEGIVDALEDYYDLLEARAVLDDPRTKFISLEEARKEYLDNNIKKVRKRGKITQKELAKRLRVSQARVSQIENIDHRPTMKVYKKVAKALGCKVEELI